MKTKAYSYIRFSRPEQIKGNSLDRQMQLSEQYCTENNLELDTKLTLHDKGISAYRGLNIEQGALGEFLKAIEDGSVPKGSYLLVESLDRLSRDKVTIALRLFLSILEQGIVIVTLSDGIKYEDSEINPYELIISITIMTRAHEESEMKSKRLLAANKNKRKNIEIKKLTGMCPAWLSLNEDKTKFILDKEKVKIIKKIFKLSEEGNGIYLIIKYLTTNNIKPIGNSNTWYPGYITKILKGRTVLGDFISKSADGEQIYENYYPKIISEDLYYKVQAGISSRRIKSGGRKGKNITNLFSKIIFCGYSTDSQHKSEYRCELNNETMTYVDKSKKKNSKYLICRAVKSGYDKCGKCKKMWPYKGFETSFLKFVKEININNLLENNDLESKINDMNSEIITANGKIEYIDKKIFQITEAALENDNKLPAALLNKLKELEEDKSLYQNKVTKLNDDLLQQESQMDDFVETGNKLSELIELLPTLKGEQLYNIRFKLSILFKKVIDKIEMYSVGRVHNYDSYLLQYGQEAVDILLENEKKSPNVPYFTVKFMNGDFRHIMPTPNKPDELIVTITNKEIDSTHFG